MSQEQDVVIDLLDGSIKPEGVSLFPWVQMTPDVPEKHPDQAWLLRGLDGSLPGVTLGVFGKHLTRIDLGLSFSDGKLGSFRAELPLHAAQARLLAQALLSAAALFEERLAALKGGAA
jgi:hypothetical protein